MGTRMQATSYLPGYYSTRNLNEDSNNCGWPLCHGDKASSNGQYYSGFLERISTASYPGYDKDAVKQKMLEHEAVFKNQVYELHRLYRVQKELMGEIRRKYLHRNQIPAEKSLSSSPLVSQISPEDARKWHNHQFPFANSFCATAPVPGVESIISPLNSIKGTSSPTGSFRSQNGDCSKDLEVLESRPTKFRRKMIDLQLPADEYIDTEEGDRFSDHKIPAISCNFLDKNCKIMLQSAMKSFLDDGGKDGCKTGALKSDSRSRSVDVLVDLNEPVQFEETKERNASTYVNLLGYNSCNGKIEGSDLSAKPSSQLPCLPKEISLYSYNGCNKDAQNNIILESRERGKGWFSHVFEAGQNKSNLNTAAHCFQTAKLPMSSQSTQVSLSTLNEPASYLTEKNKVDLWEERKLSGSVDISEGTHNLTNSKNLGSFSATYVPSPYALPPTSDFSKSLCHSISSWENPTSCSSQKSVTVQTHPGFKSSVTLSKSVQSSVQSNGIFGDRWCLNSRPRYNQGYGNEMPCQDRVYPGSSSRSKEPSVCFPSVGNENNGPPEFLTSHGSTNYGKDSSCTDTKSGKDMNLNMAFLNGSSKQEVPMLDLESVRGEQQQEDHLAGLPWLRAKPACKIEAANLETILKSTEMTILQSSVNQSSNKSEITKDSKQLLSPNKKSGSSAIDVDTGTERCDFPSNKKLLGFPIFEKPNMSKSESSSHYSSVSPLHPTESKLENNSKHRAFDINVSYDSSIPDLASQDATDFEVVENGKEARNSSFRQCIDLNFHLSDDEESLEPSAPSTSVRITAQVHLEASIVPETDDNAGEASALEQNETSLESPQQKSRSPQDELLMTAAEAIVAMSSLGCNIYTDQTSCIQSTTISKDSSLVNPLAWFVDIVSSCANDLESMFYGKDGEDNEKYSLEVTDYFEYMTLKLIETKEDYVPKPLIPESLKLEETGTTFLSNRPRRGHARRGRQRRDFQRDILPSLASLSRHEVTEDLQTFGGLMQATGHSWHSGLTRRNSMRSGSARGRRRSIVTRSPPVATCPASTTLMQQLNNLEVGLEDKNLTGWGKTTRKPRRQRFPAGNPVSVALT